MLAGKVPGRRVHSSRLDRVALSPEHSRVGSQLGGVCVQADGFQ